MTTLARRTLSLPLATALIWAAAVPALAQDEPQATTISQVAAGSVTGSVRLEGAALWQLDEEEFLFSDGSGVISIDIDGSTAESAVPLFEPIGIEGTVVSDEIDVTSWELLPIMTAAVIVPEEQVIEAYWGWIIAFGSQAPAE